MNLMQQNCNANVLKQANTLVSCAKIITVVHFSNVLEYVY